MSEILSITPSEKLPEEQEPFNVEVLDSETLHEMQKAKMRALGRRQVSGESVSALLREELGKVVGQGAVSKENMSDDELLDTLRHVEGVLAEREEFQLEAEVESELEQADDANQEVISEQLTDATPEIIIENVKFKPGDKVVVNAGNGRYSRQIRVVERQVGSSEVKLRASNREADRNEEGPTLPVDAVTPQSDTALRPPTEEKLSESSADQASKTAPESTSEEAPAQTLETMNEQEFKAGDIAYKYSDKRDKTFKRTVRGVSPSGTLADVSYTVGGKDGKEIIERVPVELLSASRDEAKAVFEAYQAAAPEREAAQREAAAREAQEKADKRAARKAAKESGDTVQAKQSSLSRKKAKQTRIDTLDVSPFDEDDVRLIQERRRLGIKDIPRGQGKELVLWQGDEVTAPEYDGKGWAIPALGVESPHPGVKEDKESTGTSGGEGVGAVIYSDLADESGATADKAEADSIPHAEKLDVDSDSHIEAMITLAKNIAARKMRASRIRDQIAALERGEAASEGDMSEEEREGLLEELKGQLAGLDQQKLDELNSESLKTLETMLAEFRANSGREGKDAIADRIMALTEPAAGGGEKRLRVIERIERGSGAAEQDSSPFERLKRKIGASVVGVALAGFIKRRRDNREDGKLSSEPHYYAEDESMEQRDRRNDAKAAIGVAALVGAGALALGGLWVADRLNDDEESAKNLAKIEKETEGSDTPDDSVETPPELGTPGVPTPGSERPSEASDGDIEVVEFSRDGQTGPVSPAEIGWSANGEFGGGTEEEIFTVEYDEGLSDFAREIGSASSDRLRLIEAVLPDLIEADFVYKDESLPGAVKYGIKNPGPVDQSIVDIWKKRAAENNITINLGSPIVESDS